MPWNVYKGKNVTIHFNEKGFDEMRKWETTEAWLEEVVQNQVMPRLKDGYEYKIERGKKRLVCNVYPKTPAAARDNLKNNSLLKAIGGGGGKSKD